MTTPAADDNQPMPLDTPASAPERGHAAGTEKLPPLPPLPARPEATDLDAPPAPPGSAAPSSALPAPGQHAAPRPYPPVPHASARGASTTAESLLPPTETTPGVAPSPVDPSADRSAAAAPAAAVPVTPPHPVVPDLPRKPGAKRHLLGLVVGLFATPVGLVLAAMGIGHMVDLPAGDGALTDVFGLVLLGAGALVLGLVALLGRWSAAVPLTAGLVWGLGVGGVALWDPQGVSDRVHGVTDGRFVPGAIDHILAPAQTGSLVVLGLVLLGSGVAAGAARRAGRSFGTRTVLTQATRDAAAREEHARTGGTHRAEAGRAEAARANR